MKLLRNSLIYTVVSVLKSGIGIFVLPIYSLYLSVADYGVVSIVNSIVQVLSILVILSMGGGGMRFHYEYKDSPEIQKRLWGTIFYFVSLNALILLLITGFFHEYLLAPFVKNIPFYPYLLVGLISCFFQAGYQIHQSYFKAHQKGTYSGLLDIGHFVINISVSLLLVIAFNQKALGVIIGLASANTVFGIFSFYYFRHSVVLDKPLLKQSLLYSLPLLPHALAGWSMTLIDRLFLNGMTNISEVGIYSTAFQIANIIHMFMVALNQAYSPWFFEKTTEGEEGKKRIRDFSELFVLVFSLIGLVLSLFSPELLRLTVTKSFQAAWNVVPFLVFAFVSRSIYYMVVGPVFLKKVALVPLITFSGAVLNIMLNIPLINLYGRMGAAGASCITMFVTSIIALLLSKKVDDFKYPWIRMYIYVITGFAMSLTVFLSVFSDFTLLLIKIAVVIILTAAVYQWYGTRIKMLYFKVFKDAR
jgi:O-antigen/teichoic acid export membrane protein